MRYEVADQDVTLTVEFKVGADLVVPAAASYTLRKGDGTALLTNQSITLTDTSSVVEITVGAANNSLSGDLERRILEVTFTYNSRTYRLRQVYSLTAWLPIAAGPEDVRALLGVTENELPDQDLDLPASYFLLQNQLGGTVLDDALTAGDLSEIQANKAIVILTGLSVLPSIQLRAVNEEGAPDHKYARFSKVDFDKLEQDLRGQLSELLTALSTSGGEATPTLLALSNQTDVITGA